jgi:hypothetical protein
MTVTVGIATVGEVEVLGDPTPELWMVNVDPAIDHGDGNALTAAELPSASEVETILRPKGARKTR